jgi:hypothetical protein
VSALDRVVIDDFANPRFPPEIEELRAGLEAMAPSCPLEPDALCEAAAEQTGLDDFGDGSYRGRLDVLCGALREEAGLSPAGVVGAHSQLLQLLKNRLLIQQLLSAHPEIRKVPIERPIIICGLPRTGTTHLHNLIAADPSMRYLPYWESLEPVLPEHERPGPGAADPRIARTDASLTLVNSAMPLFERMHEMTTEHAHEEIQLLAIDFSTMLFETIAPMPTWRDFYRSSDQTPSYSYLRTVLQALVWLRGGTRWVLKSPQHLEQFAPLVSTFPDATFVVTHRDPVSVTASLTTMMTYTARMFLDPIDPQRVGGYWRDRVQQLLTACAEDRDVLPADHSIDVRFQDLLADDMATVRSIYSVAGQPMPPESEAAMGSFLEQHARGRHGSVLYHLEPFGIDPAERREAMRFYSERFGLEDEPLPD